jgi:hypothetical protein
MPKDFQSEFEAGCRYCGGEAYLGGRDAQGLLAGVNKWNFMCKPCAEEYHGFLKRKFPDWGDCDLTKEEAATLAANINADGGFLAVLAELEKHMKEWVDKRKSQ